MKMTTLNSALIALLLAGCNGADAPSDSAPATVGSDKDKHGCIASAGYQWCASTAQCERPWELAQQSGFDNSPEAFQAFCKP